MSERPKIQELGEALLLPPLPGSVTDRMRVATMQKEMPNVHNAWTYVVPTMARFAKNAGKRGLFGKDKGANAYDEFLRRIRLVVVGLYADGVISPGTDPEVCMYELVSSLVTFKQAYPNWQDAYLVGYMQFVKSFDVSLDLIDRLQRDVETHRG